MKQIIMDTGKDIITFDVDGINCKISSSSSLGIFNCNPQTFKEQGDNKKYLRILRRNKGEKFFNEWRKDMQIYSTFKNEEDIVNDIITDFHKKRGYRIIKNG